MEDEKRTAALVQEMMNAVSAAKLIKKRSQKINVDHFETIQDAINQAESNCEKRMMEEKEENNKKKAAALVQKNEED